MYYFFIFVLLVGGGVLFLVKFLERQRLLKESLNLVLLEVSLPKEERSAEAEHQPQFRIEVSKFEQLLGALHDFQHPVTLEIAVHHVGEQIHFYFAVNRKEREALERQIHGFWPEARIEQVEDYNIFNPHGASSAGRLTLNKHYSLPIKIYDTMDADPFAAVISAFSKLEKEGEGASLQINFVRASNNEAKTIAHVLEEVRKGKKYEEAAYESRYPEELKLFGRAVAGKPLHGEAEKINQPAEPKVVDRERVAAIEKKLAKPLFFVDVRIITSAADQTRAQNILDQIERSFGQFAQAQGNSFKFLNFDGSRLQSEIFDYSFRNFRYWGAMILNTGELASLVHIPTHGVEVPRLAFVKARSATPPMDLPDEGITLGKSVYRNEERPVRMKQQDRSRHLYMVGQTGTGKSNLIREMVRQDLEQGAGLALIDPHGDLAEAVLGFVPADRIKDVVYFNPTDIARPVALNLLEYDPGHPEQKTFIINEMIEILDKLYDLRQTGGPMFEQYMRNAMLLVMGDPIIKATLMEVPRVLADSAYRHELLSRSTNPVVVSFWTKEAEKAGGEAALANMVPYITSKLNPFVSNEIVRPIIGQINSAFKAREVMDQGKILIINLAKGVLGETNGYLLGMIIVGKILMSALSRTDIPENQRRPFYLYIDEFQNVTTKSIASIMSEARKYGLSLIVAHQFIAQLKEEIRDAVFGNVGSQLSFRVGPQDAEFLVKQFAPVFTAQDLINLDNYNAYLKLMIDGQTSPAFNIVTNPPTPDNAQVAAAVKEFSSLTYGRPRDEVEKEIFDRYVK